MIGRVVCLIAVCVLGLNAADDFPGFDSGTPGGSGQSKGDANWERTQRQSQYRPFGSDRPCSALINETLTQNDSQVLVERILITADTMGTSFSSSTFTGGSNQQLDTWASQACGQMQNVVGYLKSACQYSSTSGTSGSSSTSSQATEMVAQKKLAALNSVKDYLCNNNQVNLKEMAMNNGAQCARKTDLNDMGCNLQMGPQPSFVPMLPQAQRQSLKYGTAIALSMFTYNGDECRYISDVLNCIMDKYNRGTDFCSPRAATHFGRIFDTILQAVQCKTGGYSTFNNFDTSNSFNNNPSFNRFPSNNFPNNQNNFPNNNNFPQNNFPQGSNSWGQNNFGQSNVGQNNWPQNQQQQPNNNNWGQNSGFGSNNWNNQNPNNFGGSSGSSGSSGSWQPGSSSNQQFGISSFSSQSGTVPPYNPYSRRPYGYNGGTVAQATGAIMVTTLIAACLAY